MRRMRKPSGLTAWFGGLLLLAASFSILLFSCVYFGGGALLSRYFEESDFTTRSIERHISSFQNYVDQNGLSAGDTAEITIWAKNRPLILLEIYRSNVLLYTSFAPEELAEAQNEAEVPYYDWVSYHEVIFSDGPAEVVIYSDDTYVLSSARTIAALVLAFSLFLLIFLRGCRGLIRYICRLSAEIQAMEGGDLDVPITIQDDHELTQLARSLDSMRTAFKEQRERESAIFHANQTMITQMSHDLRTPLTTLQIYTDILRFKKYDPDQLDSYLERIDAKAGQIKQLAEHIFEYSLVSRHQDIRLDAPAPMRQVFHDQLSECVGHLEQQGFRFELDLEWPEVGIAVYPPYIKRLIDNISSNIIRYADPAVPILMEVNTLQDSLCLSVQNAIRHDIIKDREGTNIGLTNMRTMMEKMQGQCQVIRTESSFRVILTFPKAVMKDLSE